MSRCSSSRSSSAPGDVEVLAADHPERRLGQLAREPGRRIAEREPERLDEQGVAREQRDPLAERDVRARPAAALVVVVERRQVVVDEREGVHELERGRAGSAASGSAPAASAVARQITARIRFPPSRA